MRNIDNEREFHLNRRMFCITGDTLHIADENIPLTHKEWFIQGGFLYRDEDPNFENIVRGFFNDKGLFFYRGNDFRVDDESEKIFFSYLQEIVKELGIDLETKIYGGFHIGDIGKEWKPKTEYGNVGECLSGGESGIRTHGTF